MFSEKNYAAAIRKAFFFGFLTFVLSFDIIDYYVKGVYYKRIRGIYDW